MQYIAEGFREAFALILSGDAEFLLIVVTSVELAIISTLLAALPAIPLGIMLGITQFRGKRVVEGLVDTLMSLPTVLIGLTAYALLSRSGPLGDMGLLYTKTAVIVGQAVLIVPIILSLTATAAKNIDRKITRTLLGLGADTGQIVMALIRESRLAILGALIASFGRVFGEVGISMMLGGNIKGYTRTITTAIALETAKGEFALGIALGLVLLAIALGINMALTALRKEKSA